MLHKCKVDGAVIRADKVVKLWVRLLPSIQYLNNGNFIASDLADITIRLSNADISK